jgi:adenosylcobinamide-GDP ribazoletransferase
MPDHIRLETQLFLLALRFLTRIRVPGNLPNSDDLELRATKYHPLVGCLIGAMGAVTMVIGGWALPWSAAVFLATGVTLLATGAFHEMGLARAADAIGAAQTRDEALEILDDRYLAGYGVMSIGMVMALKLTLLIHMPGWVAGAALIAGHAVGRMATVHIVATTYLAREVGARARVPGVTPDGYWIALGTACASLILVWIVMGIAPAISGFLGAVVLGQLFRWLIMRKFGGYTGNCLGGVQQVAELGTYLGIAVWL